MSVTAKISQVSTEVVTGKDAISGVLISQVSTEVVTSRPLIPITSGALFAGDKVLLVPPNTLQGNTAYRWRVKPLGLKADAPWSDLCGFTTVSWAGVKISLISVEVVRQNI